MDNNSTEWNINTDIYDIVNSLNEVKKRYIDDETETTLALGIYGYVTDTEAKKIQTSTIMTGHLGNEMFPTRSKLTKNVLAHAIYCNIQNINAVPAHMTINIGIKVEDFERYAEDSKFIIDHMCPVFVGEYEFHFDYDILLSRSKKEGSNVYSAHYIMDIENRISNIVDPYLKQPFVIKIGNFEYIVLQSLVRQVTIEETIDKIISDSIIETKTYTFEFDNQIADFDVVVTDNGKETRLVPVPYGASTEGIDNYCWYLFITDSTIRITFDSKSYIPGLNSDIYIKAYTTLGEDGVYKYTKIDDSSEGFYTDLKSDTYNYDRITCYTVAVSDSVDGTNRKTKSELQKLIPKAALSRGSITTETDVSNYFNLIDSETNRLVMQKKVDNQLSRIWYSYFLLKDENNNIIPTNTIKIRVYNPDNNSSYINSDGKYIDDISRFVTKTDKRLYEGRYILPAGTILKYDRNTGIAEAVDEMDVPEPYSDEYFKDSRYYYYMTIYTTLIDPNPLYSAFYLSVSNKNKFFVFDWVNDDSDLQFIVTNCNFNRKLLTEQNIYSFSFKMAQSINKDYEMYVEEQVEVMENGKRTKKTIITNNMKCILVLYHESEPYRWVELELQDFDKTNYISSWKIDLETDNTFDMENNICIRNLCIAGKDSTYQSYGFFEPNTTAKLYILGKFSDGIYGRYDLDTIAPGFINYTVTNVYEIDDGLDFYENFTNILDTKVTPNYFGDDNYTLSGVKSYDISGVPVVGLHYMISEEYADYLTDAIIVKKAYIDYCLILLENSLNVDFKFFNTYGPSRIYTIGDKEETLIDHVDLSMNFRLCLKNLYDAYTKDDLITEIKDYIEDLYGEEEWHAPNMITKLTNDFASRIVFIEFMNYNTERLGIQHICKLDPEDPTVVPEFINIRNKYNKETMQLEPCIDIDIVQ